MDRRFDWSAQLVSAYHSFPEARRRPVIGITGNYGDQTCKLGEGYYKSVWKAGGVPVIIPPLKDVEAIINMLVHIDGLLLSGGADFNPLYAGEEPIPHLGGINAARDLPELLMTQLAYNLQIPMFGICRGVQTLALALGGRVAQDIESERGKHSDEASVAVKHSQDADRSEPTHSVTVEQDSVLYGLYKDSTLYVNSFHHQAVSEPGPHFRVTAWSADGVVEAIESCEYKSIIGVQWHPECLPDADAQPLFSWFVGEAAHYREACDKHQRILTFDSHCDTPMFFSQGIDFGSRDPRILVDLHKMTEGHLDATVMVAYLPQPGEGESFASKVDFEVEGPVEYADLILDKIESMVETNRQYVSIARTPDELYANKQKGLKSIMLGIENGLAIGGSLANLRHFAARGIVYMTLCHNGDNDICDSARGQQTHHGVSNFGQQVILEMNKLGVMVDLSHASEKSFYDAIDMSSMPIVCSHSCCRALCDHSRNLTDNQMRALAASGGVMQLTLYHGFLAKDGEATVMDALRHLDHAVQVMGIEHVGIGTDFDGDGGVPGLADASEMVNFMRHLMRRRYSDDDLERIWGANFLRLMKVVQSNGIHIH